MPRVYPNNSDATYREVRGLSRGIAVLRALNTLPGGIGGVVEIAKLTDIHRTTVKRLLETLKAEGLVLQKDDGTSYALGFEVRRLSEGYIGTDWIDAVAAPAMNAHLRSLSWPSDLATPDNGFMIVRESTHRSSMLSQHRATIGIKIPILVSSLGRAWLSWCADDEREATLASLRQRTDEIGELANNKRYVNRLLRETRKRGYAVNKQEWLSESSINAIAFPLFLGSVAVGAINLVTRADLVSEKDLDRRFAPLLRTLADDISRGITARQQG